MSAWRRALVSIAVGSLAVGCSGSAPPANLSPEPADASSLMSANRTAAAKASHAASRRPLDSGSPLPAVTYEIRGRRDPFVPVLGAQDAVPVEIQKAKLTGIVEGREFVALVEWPDGLGYALRTGDALGSARVIKVERHSITFAVARRAHSSDSSPTPNRAASGDTSLTLTLAMD
jgi:Tfp pilus assembly protein PilP